MKEFKALADRPGKASTSYELRPSRTCSRNMKRRIRNNLKNKAVMVSSSGYYGNPDENYVGFGKSGMEVL